MLSRNTGRSPDGQLSFATLVDRASAMLPRDEYTTLHLVVREGIPLPSLATSAAERVHLVEEWRRGVVRLRVEVGAAWLWNRCRPHLRAHGIAGATASSWPSADLRSAIWRHLDECAPCQTEIALLPTALSILRDLTPLTVA
jgi:hypothetical protein